MLDWECFWFTVEIGLCRENGQLKACGAGLLSSYGKLEYCLSDEPETKAFEPTKAALENFPITKYQPIYYVSESFKDSKNKIIKYASKIPTPFRVRYNATVQSMEVSDSEQQIETTLQNDAQKIEYV
ncbi:hypothetical protein FQA39_LY05652 [Lamprigera yunnana]|nr:hypothetical protein FQA39_LY05652 [Lamprigera yunnana]